MLAEIAPAYVVLGMTVIAQAIISWASHKYTKEAHGKQLDDHEDRIRSLEIFKTAKEAVDKMLKRGEQ